MKLTTCCMRFGIQISRNTESSRRRPKMPTSNCWVKIPAAVFLHSGVRACACIYAHKVDSLHPPNRIAATHFIHTWICLRACPPLLSLPVDKTQWAPPLELAQMTKIGLSCWWRRAWTLSCSTRRRATRRFRLTCSCGSRRPTPTCRSWPVTVRNRA